MITVYFSRNTSPGFESDGLCRSDISLQHTGFDLFGYHPRAVHKAKDELGEQSISTEVRDQSRKLILFGHCDLFNKDEQVVATDHISHIVFRDIGVRNLMLRLEEFQQEAWKLESQGELESSSRRIIRNVLMRIEMDNTYVLNSMDMFFKFINESRQDPAEYLTPAIKQSERDVLWSMANFPGAPISLNEIWEQEKALMEVHNA